MKAINKNKLKTNIMTKLEYALHYSENLRFTVIPLKPMTKGGAYFSWTKYQEQKPTAEEIRNWWTKYPNANIGIICGSISGIAVIDVDKPNLFKKSGINCPSTASVKSKKGFHLYYKMPKNIKIPSMKFAWGELQSGNNLLIVTPPSIHPEGVTYTWATGLPKTSDDIEEFPTELLEKLTSMQNKKTDTQINESIEKGNRNNTLASIAGKLLFKTPKENWNSVVLPMLHEINKLQCKPPLTQNEILRIFKSISSAEGNKREKRPYKKEEATQADIALKLFLEELNIETFQDERNDAYVRININGHHENWHCDSGRLKSWMSRSFYAKYKNVLRSDVIKSIVEVLKGKALFCEEKRHSLSSRLSYDKNVLWYDLVNPTWSAVKINKDGWSIVKTPPILFKRFEHQKEQVIPVSGGDPHDILDFVNIQDQEQKILFMVFLISAFIPDFPHPMPFFYGPQGSAKSTVSKVIRQLIDPSHIEVSQFPKKQDELVQMFDHHTILFFDNISYISQEQSDMLCKVITGGAFSKRKLYSDNDDIIYSFKKTVGMNGISLVLTKPDILERSLLFPLERVSKSNRVQEEVLLKNFEDKLPMIFGSILDTISKAMFYKESIKLEQTPRMADFAIWGSAIAKALGYKEGVFMDAYWKNIDSQDMEILYEDTTAGAIMQFMENKYEWSGTASELLEELERLLDFSSRKSLPKSHSALSRKLNSLAVTLKKADIVFKKVINDRARNIHLINTANNAVDADTEDSG